MSNVAEGAIILLELKEGNVHKVLERRRGAGVGAN